MNDLALEKNFSTFHFIKTYFNCRLFQWNRLFTIWKLHEGTLKYTIQEQFDELLCNTYYNTVFFLEIPRFLSDYPQQG